jgi:glycerol-1-phosphatase
VLGASTRPLVEAYDLVMLDLDGVVYIGDAAVTGAPEHLARARAAGVHLAFITNNASRPPAAVVDRLAGLGIAAEVGDVVTSAQAAAHVLAEQYGPGAVVATLGATGLVEALQEAGLTPTGVTDDAAVALVSGYGPDVPWKDLMTAAVRIRDGLPWVASNADLTLPTKAGLAPGHGVLVDMLARFTGVAPVVAGKPQRPLLDETVRRVGGTRPLMVGDRLDTDIEGAYHAQVDSLLVMTGVTGVAELAAARPTGRPTYLAVDLAGLFEPHPAPTTEAGSWRLGGWSATVDRGRLTVTGAGDAAAWWRVLAAAAWTHLDERDEPPDTDGLVPPGEPPAG